MHIIKNLSDAYFLCMLSNAYPVNIYKTTLFNVYLIDMYKNIY